MTARGSVARGRSRAPRHLYIHVPFCGARCDYCEFYAVPVGRGDGSEPSRGHAAGLLDRYVAALHGEWESARERYGVRRLETVFLGGGTPSLLGEERLERLLEPLEPLLTPRAEVTVETNPEDVTPGYAAWAAANGVRVSLGVQSFSARLRRDLGRAVSADPAVAFERLRAAGVGARRGVAGLDASSGPASVTRAGVAWTGAPALGSLGVDLIFGIPGETIDDVHDDLATVARLQPDHVSWYELSVVPGTVLDARVALTAAGCLGGNVPELPAEEAVAEMYRAAVAGLGSLGYQWYEVSNFARPGHRCCHNSAVWRGRDYIGLGPAAVGTVEGVRSRDRADLETWLTALEHGAEPPREEEALAGDVVARERLLLAARTGAPVPLAELAGVVDESAVAPLAHAGLVSAKGGTLRVTRKGRYVANAVCVRLFRDSSFVEA